MSEIWWSVLVLQSAHPQLSFPTKIFDARMTVHFVLPNAQMIKKQEAHIFFPDIPQLSVIAQIAHIVPDLAHSSLISVN